MSVINDPNPEFLTAWKQALTNIRTRKLIKYAEILQLFSISVLLVALSGAFIYYG